MSALSFLNFLNKLYRLLWGEKHRHSSQKTKEKLKKLLGVEPSEISPYLHALQFTKGGRQKFEQLEFLGDAVINLVLSEWIVERFPRWNEGQLSEWKAWLVSRRTCNQVAKLAGLEDLLHSKKAPGAVNFYRTDLGGNILEALIGAVMVDKGYATARGVVVSLWSQHLEKVVRAQGAPPPINYKGRVLSWAQQNKKKVSFESERLEGKGEFRAYVIIEGEKVSEGRGRSLLAAEEQAARLAWRKIRGGSR